MPRATPGHTDSEHAWAGRSPCAVLWLLCCAVLCIRPSANTLCRMVQFARARSKSTSTILGCRSELTSVAIERCRGHGREEHSGQHSERSAGEAEHRASLMHCLSSFVCVCVVCGSSTHLQLLEHGCRRLEWQISDWRRALRSATHDDGGRVEQWVESSVQRSMRSLLCSSALVCPCDRFEDSTQRG